MNKDSNIVKILLMGIKCYGIDCEDCIFYENKVNFDIRNCTHYKENPRQIKSISNLSVNDHYRLAERYFKKDEK